jgi:hydrogenase nickel incorporation protein HypB
VNPHCAVIRVSATTGEGLALWHGWLREQRAALAALPPVPPLVGVA